MNSWLYITPKITLLSLHRRLLCRCRFRIFPPHFQNCPQVTGVFMAKESSLRISARANMAGCLSQIWDCQQDPHLRRHNQHITIIKNTLPPSENRIRKGTTLRDSDKKGLLCAFSTFSAGRMPPNFWKFTNFGSLAYDWSTALASHHGPRTETSAKI